MELGTGAIFALTAMLFWGFGDFLIQRSAKKIGDWETLLVITLFGMIALTPFIWNELNTIPAGIIPLTIASVVLFFAALFDFEALKEGKLAIIEPVLAFEIPLTVLLAYFMLGETLTMTQIVLVCAILLGLAMLSHKSRKITRMTIEKGALIGVLGAAFMGAANFFVGYGSRITSPLLINWFINVFITLACFTFLLFSGRLTKFATHLNDNKKLLFSLTFLDNGAWIAYAFAAALIPIGIVVSISESYIALAVMLGLFVNKEKIKTHQKIGLILALAGAITLATL
ncbi:DMT family transporter [Candidatus Micrarchaeota archaeon]|nr:DMT family transporter [Candidatus Micrarchaeota archaeon]